MESFIGLDVKQSQSNISYFQETLDSCKVHPGTKMIRPKTTQMQQGNIITSANVQEMPDKQRQAFFRSMVALLQFAATWVRFDISCTVGILARFSASALIQQDHRISQHFIKFIILSREAPELQAGLSQRPEEDHRSRWFLQCRLGNERQPLIDHW